MALRAAALARRAHADQVDKAGHPYIGHVARVAARVHGDPEAEAVAWLHDVVEDCPDFADEVDAFPAPIVAAVQCLTRRDGITAEAYYAAIRANPLALKVKLADIADNRDPARLAYLPDAMAQRLTEKYAHALHALGAAPT
ncbi:MULTISPECIES: HD domain-containing protein [Stenotrophomonas]|uniref:HD domain-containing protein n=1 Tax=Stenotrophomonas TaxID=40323 RepID=UPI0021C9DE0D|nr:MULTISPECIES: HD domain-containing protein [Stenotrophomonas]